MHDTVPGLGLQEGSRQSAVCGHWVWRQGLPSLGLCCLRFPSDSLDFSRKEKGYLEV